VDRSGPAHGISYHFPDIGVVERRITLVAGSEVENLSRSPGVAAARSKDLAVGEPRQEYELLRRRNVEKLAVHLLPLELDVAIESCRDRMRWRDDPDALDLVRDTPDEIAGRSHQPFENLRMVSRVENDQPHSMKHSGLDTIDRLLSYLLMRLVPPPDEDIRFHQNALGEAIFRLIERCGADIQVIGGPQALGDRAMNPFWINRSIPLVLTLMAILVPDGDANLTHSVAPNV
jgi:hypothetical protein